MSTGLLWFRSDLRLSDHRPLRALAERCERILPVACFDPEQLEATPWGFARMSARRLHFHFQNHACLRDALRARGSDLLVLVGPARQRLPELVEDFGVDQLAFHEEAAFDEREEERALLRALPAELELHRHWGHTLTALEDLPFPLSRLPASFTPFRKRVEAKQVMHPALPEPESCPPLPPGLSDDVFLDLTRWPDELSRRGVTIPKDALEPPPDDERALFRFQPGPAGGRARLEEYIWQKDRLRIYRDTRNGMLSPDDSSRLSPWLACGALSAREVADEIRRYEEQRVANDSTYWLRFELLWRDYFRFVAREAGAQLFLPGGPAKRQHTGRWDSRAFARWCEGRTGVDVIDANMQELSATGYMTNRGRQLVASHLIHELGLDWRAGAAWFESQLLDYDPGSNYGNFAYIAGVGNDPRGGRAFNLQKQAEQYDPEGDYRRHWLGG